MSHSVFLFDFADVISLPQDMVVYSEMANLLKMNLSDFRQAYWRHRRPYDLGQDGGDYWRLVTNKDLEVQLINQLIQLDCKSWSRINALTLKLLSQLKSQRKRLALLSNLPIELVTHLRRTQNFLSLFDQVFFSAEIRLVKPDLEVYHYVLKQLKVEASEVIFFDDRNENLEAAEKLGIHTYLFGPESAIDLIHKTRV